jgi:hypothetical protein
MFGKQLPVTLSLVVVLLASALAQGQTQNPKTNAATVTAGISGTDTVRITAPGEVAEIQLQVYGVNGEVVFDSGARPGNVIDWKAADAFGAMGQGPVLVVVTTKDLHENSTQRYGSLSLEGGQLTLKREVELSPVQKETIKARRSQKSEDTQTLETLTIVSEANSPSMVLATHNGQEGQVTSTNGPLTLGTGDALTGQDKTHVRLMPDGRVGIGVRNPEATLDVNGEIRARGGHPV